MSLGARWPSGLERWLDWWPHSPGRVRIPLRKTSLRNFGSSVNPALPVSLGGDTKSRRSLLSGVYARGSKRSHQSALECVTVVNSTTHSKPPHRSAIVALAYMPCRVLPIKHKTRLYYQNTDDAPENVRTSCSWLSILVLHYTSQTHIFRNMCQYLVEKNPCNVKQVLARPAFSLSRQHNSHVMEQWSTRRCPTTCHLTSTWRSRYTQIMWFLFSATSYDLVCF